MESLLLKLCRVCRRPATVFIENAVQVALCGPTCKRVGKDKCTGHWEPDGYPEYYCAEHGKGLKPKRKRLIGYRCDYCGAKHIQHDPPPPCECSGARHEREFLRKVRA